LRSELKKPLTGTILDGEVALDAPQFISRREGKDSCGKRLGATAAKLQLDEAQASAHNLK
jgi:hypothetical protein